VRCKALNAATVRDIQGVESDFGGSAIRFKSFGLLQLRILLELRDGSFSPTLVSCSEVNQEGPIVKRRLGILEGELAHNGKTNTLVVLVDGLDSSGVADLVCASNDTNSVIRHDEYLTGQLLRKSVAV
jgi:hypothetical protein